MTKRKVGCAASLMVAMLLCGPASAVVIVDMDFENGLQNNGIAGDVGTLLTGASISNGELLTNGDSLPEPDGAGLDLDIGVFQAFSGNGDFLVEFDFASVDGDEGPLFSADGSFALPDMGVEGPGDQSGGLNIWLEDGEVVVDIWYRDVVGVAGGFNDNAFHHVEVLYDAAETEIILTVDDLEPAFLFVEDGFSRDTSNDLTRVGDRNNADLWGPDDLEGFNGRFDNLVIEGPSPPPVKLIVDRTTGDVSMEVLADVNLDELVITSDAGTLEPGGYDGLAAAGGDFADWEVSVAEAFEIVEGGSTGALTEGQSFELGSGVWLPFFDEELGIEIYDTDLGSSIDGVIEYEGDEILFGDLDLDGEVNEADWLLFAAGYGSELDEEEQTPRDAYFLADLTMDFVHDAEDFTEFVIAFDEFNGEGAFAALIGGSVPEPGTLALLGIVLAGLAVTARRRTSPLIGRSLALLLVVTAMMALAAPAAQADLLAQYLFGSGFEDTSGNSRTGIPQTEFLTQPTVSGGRIQMTGEPLEYMEIPLGAANPFDGSQNFAVQMLFNTTGNPDEFTGVILFGSATFDAGLDAWEQEHPMSIFVEPHYEEEGEILGGALVYDNFFVGEVRTPELQLMDGDDHTVSVIYVAPDDLGDPLDPNPGRVFIQVDDEWVGRGEIAPNIPDIATTRVSLGTTMNTEFPFEFDPDENSYFTQEFKGSMDDVHIWDGQDAADLAPSELRATVNVNDRTIELLGGDYFEEIKFYEITSENGSLNPAGWVHGNLDAQDIGEGDGVGENWDALDGSEERLAEGLLIGTTEMEDGDVLTLTNAYNPYFDGELRGTDDGVDETLTITIVDADLEIRELAIEFVGEFCAFAADFDCDADVDGDDFLIWQNGFGFTNGLAKRQDGDADGDGDVDGDDFLVWQSQFGSVEGGASAVPEPSGLLLAVIALLGLWPVAVRRRAA